jgi:formylglycine-generating enzyme required for sulfatase activity/serine/threonine protein kinase
MSDSKGKETLFSILDTWYEIADPKSSSQLGEKTYRLDATFIQGDVGFSMPKPESKWPGHFISGDVGKGGMGVIHKAKQEKLRRTVALKTPNHPELNARFTEEALISGYLTHPNIIAVHDLIRGQDDSLGLTMPLIDGISWKDKLEQDYARADGPLPEHSLRKNLDYLIKVCQAVSYAHFKGILHNDLKLENIMVGDFGDVVVMDWGCATLNPEVSTELPFGVLHPKRINRPFGSPCYMPPELARGQGDQVGPWSDTYLIGAMLYEIVEGRPPRSGETLGDVIESACDGKIDDFKYCQSPTLQQICRQALAPAIQERYQNPKQFEEVLRGYFRAEQSEALLDSATRLLLAQSQNTSVTESHNSLVTLIEVVSMSQQADQLWPSDSAKEKEVEASRKLVLRAIDMGDLDIAAAYLDGLPENDHRDLHESLLRAKTQRKQELQAFERSRSLTRSVIVLVMLGLSLGGILINRAREEAVTQQQIAQDRLVELTSLSDIQTVQQLRKDMEQLWPLRERNIGIIEKWIGKAEQLTKRKSIHKSHHEALSSNEEGVNPQLLAWELGIVSSLLKEIEDFEAVLIPEVKQRLQFTVTLRQRSIDEQQQKWDAAIKSIQNLPTYNGLTIEPQIGIIPIRQDPDSGLWEFFHLQSGSVPSISDGKYVRTKETGIVLVLLPESQFWMGAEKNGKKNIDKRAKVTEGPVHLVSVAPFFLSKYEMNQGQWQRISENNPSAYPVGTDVKPRPITALHPIEQITWSEASEALHKYDLILPTEAQWEYAARGIWTETSKQPPSNSIFWTGDSVSSLQGTLNISDVGGRKLGSPESWRLESELNDGHIVHAPTGIFRANPFGLHDMLGNVWEWCSDRFGDYTLPVETGTARRLVDDENAPRLFRGGGFRASSVHVRSADRYSIYAADYRAYDVGVRPARALE